MSSIKIGVIGGSGVYKIEGVELIKEHKIMTPFGAPSSEIIEAKLNGTHFYFIPRHGKSHSLTPSEVNYRANIFALKELGVEFVISVSAVGSLKDLKKNGIVVFLAGINSTQLSLDSLQDLIVLMILIGLEKIHCF